MPFTSVTTSRTIQAESTVIELARLLTDRMPAELAATRGELEKLATDANLPVLRQLGFAALIAADGKARSSLDVRDPLEGWSA